MLCPPAALEGAASVSSAGNIPVIDDRHRPTSLAYFRRPARIRPRGVAPSGPHLAYKVNRVARCRLGVRSCLRPLSAIYPLGEAKCLYGGDGVFHVELRSTSQAIISREGATTSGDCLIG